MRYPLFIFACLVLLLVISCKKNDSNSSGGNRIDSITIRKTTDNIVIGGVKFKYDNAGNLVQYFDNNQLASQFKYDAQNRLISSTYISTNTNSPVLDTFVYGGNGQISRSYQHPVGIYTNVLTHAFIYDSRDRLETDSVYDNNGYPSSFYKYKYNSNDDLLSNEIYSRAGNSYYRQDSTSFTHDVNDNPFYKNRSVMYFVRAAFNPLSKHNIISRAVFYGTSTQTNNSASFIMTYYTGGLVRTNTFPTNNLSDRTTWEFLYK